MPADIRQQTLFGDPSPSVSTFGNQKSPWFAFVMGVRDLRNGGSHQHEHQQDSSHSNSSMANEIGGSTCFGLLADV